MKQATAVSVLLCPCVLSVCLKEILEDSHVPVSLFHVAFAVLLKAQKQNPSLFFLC